VVAHGGVISVYACALLGCSFNALWRLRVDNASLTVVRPPRLVSLNDTAHLPGASRPPPTSAPPSPRASPPRQDAPRRRSPRRDRGRPRAVRRHRAAALRHPPERRQPANAPRAAACARCSRAWRATDPSRWPPGGGDGDHPVVGGHHADAHRLRVGRAHDLPPDARDHPGRRHRHHVHRAADRVQGDGLRPPARRPRLRDHVRRAARSQGRGPGHPRPRLVFPRAQVILDGVAPLRENRLASSSSRRWPATR